MLNLAQSKAIRLTLSCALCLATVFLLIAEIAEVTGESSSLGGILVIDALYSFLLPDAQEVKEKKKKIFYLRNLRCKSMDTGIFDLLRGKQIEVRTIDEYIKGVAISTEGDFLIIEKDKKNVTETVYVNKSVIQTVKVIKQK